MDAAWRGARLTHASVRIDRYARILSGCYVSRYRGVRFSKKARTPCRDRRLLF
jgi:hypothetical protein